MIIINSANNMYSNLTRVIVESCRNDWREIDKFGLILLPSLGYRYKMKEVTPKMMQIGGRFIDDNNLVIQFENPKSKEELGPSEIEIDMIKWSDAVGLYYDIYILTIKPSYESKTTFDWVAGLIHTLSTMYTGLVEVPDTQQQQVPQRTQLKSRKRPVFTEPEPEPIPEPIFNMVEESTFELEKPNVINTDELFEAVGDVTDDVIYNEAQNELTKEEEEEIGNFARKFQEEEVAKRNADPSNIKVSKLHNAIYVTKWLLKPDLSIKARQEPLVYGIPDLMRYRELGMLSSIGVPSCVERFLDEYDYRGEEVLNEYEQM